MTPKIFSYLTKINMLKYSKIDVKKTICYKNISLFNPCRFYFSLISTLEELFTCFLVFMYTENSYSRRI